jgi:hypothetical protein
MNKLREQFRQRLLGQLSDEKTEVDINNAVDVCKDFTFCFISFLARNFENLDIEGKHFRCNKFGTVYSTEELYNRFLEIYGK